MRLKKEQEEKEKADAHAEKEAAMATQREKELKEQANNELTFLKTAINIAEISISEGNDEFQACMNCTNLNRKKLQQAQAKIDMGLKRKATLLTQMETLEKKKKTNSS